MMLYTDKKAAFFVGDAAGRADDFASTDRKWAINVGIQFHTPEVSPCLFHLVLFHVKRLMTGRNTFSVSPKLPTSSPDSTYPLSQRVSYMFSSPFPKL